MRDTNKITPLVECVQLFEKNSAAYTDASYNEAKTRNDFINKFFECLDWDVANKKGRTEVYREVVFEESVSVGGSKKKPDYSFRIGGRVIFFVEAKKPSVNLISGAAADEAAYQLRRYGHSAKLPISILTNFKEFAIYDTRVKPNKNDNAGVARINYWTYDQYEEAFDFIYGILSSNGIQEGNLDKYVGAKGRKGTSEVDDDLLELVEGWRLELAKNIAKNNPNLEAHEINVVVQRIIDRVIFLRIAEDKGIEPEYSLLSAVDKATNIYRELAVLFKNADRKYNAGLFAKTDWIEGVTVGDNVLSEIITGLYDCPYEFSVLPIEILGSMYERFLGKTIRFRNIGGGVHTVQIEEKPEVKKAGGVYYTPQYIVDYIVKNTLGEKIKNKRPEDISEIKICDPSCGSGAFLIGAYQYLLNYHLDYYTQSRRIKSALTGSKIYESAAKSYKLTIKEKQRILKNNIFGVDIDSQAVEVTKLSLYLKLLEGEGKEAEGQIFKHSDLTLLPSLEENIKCGNSLVGTDFYAQASLDLSDDMQMKLNCFDWAKEFPDIFKGGGFDVVIGNPPYYNIQTLGANSEIANYIQMKYADIWQDKSDILFYFVAKAMKLSKDNIGFILSNAFLFSDKAQKLRNAIVKDNRLSKIVNFEQYQVFKKASITTGIFIFNKDRIETKAAVLKETSYLTEFIVDLMNNDKNYFKVSLSPNDVFALVNSNISRLNKKIDGKHPMLDDVYLVGKGMETAKNEVFVFEDYPSQFPKKFIKKRMVGENIKRYFLKKKTDYLLYFENVTDFKMLPESIQTHLKNNRRKLAGRADKKRRKTASWWNYTFAMHKEHYHLPKIWCSYRSSNNAFILDETNDYIGLTNTTVIFVTNPEYNPKYVLALLNSKLLEFRYKNIAKQTGGGVFEYLPNGLGKLPIAQADAETQNKIAALVDKMLELKKHEAAEPNQHRKSMIAKQIIGVDGAIDAAVYELYGLGEKEIKIVEC